MIEAARVAEVMGGLLVLGTRIASVHDLSEAVAGGLPKQALRSTAQRVYRQGRDANQLMRKVVPEATYKRRTRLTPAESERTERLARVIAAAEHVWNDRHDAREWLISPHPELNGQTPIECGMMELGARRVEELLDRMFYGLPA